MSASSWMNTSGWPRTEAHSRATTAASISMEHCSRSVSPAQVRHGTQLAAASMQEAHLTLGQNTSLYCGAARTVQAWRSWCSMEVAAITCDRRDLQAGHATCLLGHSSLPGRAPDLP